MPSLTARRVVAHDMAFGAVLAVVHVIGARAIFASVDRYAVRSGLIARCSAETVS
jgi:hypothetical protein